MNLLEYYFILSNQNTQKKKTVVGFGNNFIKMVVRLPPLSPALGWK
jgi:hypothetical protein